MDALVVALEVTRSRNIMRSLFTVRRQTPSRCGPKSLLIRCQAMHLLCCHKLREQSLPTTKAIAVGNGFPTCAIGSHSGPQVNPLFVRAKSLGGTRVLYTENRLRWVSGGEGWSLETVR